MIPASTPVVPEAALEPVEIARSLRPLLAQHAAQAEAQGRATDEVIQALREAGLFRLMFPKRAGGVGHKLITHTSTVAELGKACAGTAWAFGLLSSVTASVASMPAAVKERVFQTGDELVCSVAAPTGTAVACPDGYVVSGSWGYASGSLHADWALNGVRILDAQGQQVDAGFALLPLKGSAQVTIQNTWHVTGVAASGSNTVVAQEAVIPAVQVLRFSEMRRAAANPAAAAAMEPRDRWPMEPLFPMVVLAPMLGAASGMLELVLQGMPKRAVIGRQFASQQDSQVMVGQVGQAAMEIDTAWLQIRRAASMLDVTAQERPLSGFEKARIQADCGHAMSQLRSAGERLMEVAGPAAFALGNPLQRLWRDLNVGSRHTALQSRLSHELYGRALLGQASSLALLPSIGH